MNTVERAVLNKQIEMMVNMLKQAKRDAAGVVTSLEDLIESMEDPSQNVPPIEAEKYMAHSA